MKHHSQTQNAKFYRAMAKLVRERGFAATADSYEIYARDVFEPIPAEWHGQKAAA